MNTLAKDTEDLARTEGVRKAVSKLIDQEKDDSDDKVEVKIVSRNGKDRRTVVIRRVEKT